MTTTVAALAASALVLAACGSSPPGEAPVSPSTSPAHDPAGHIVATAASNKTAAESETRRLLTLLVLPQGATRFNGSPPADLDSPATGTESAARLIDATQFWRVPLDQNEMPSWVRAHAPSGFTLETSASGSGADGVSLAGPPDRSAPDNAPPHLAVSALDGSNASIWRVDAMQVWYDPTPVRVAPARHTVHISTGQGCPDNLADATDVANSYPGLDEAMLPPGDPTSALVCQYPGGNPSIDQPKEQRVLTAEQAAKLAAQARALRLGSPSGVYNCPMDDGQATIVAFGFGQRDVDLWLRISGCGSIDNGHIVSLTGTLRIPQD